MYTVCYSDKGQAPRATVSCETMKMRVRRMLLLPVEYEKWDLGAKIKSPEAQNKSYLFCTRLKEIQKLARGYNLHAIRIISTFSEAFSSCAYKMTCSYFDVSITADVCLRTVLGRRRGGGGPRQQDMVCCRHRKGWESTGLEEACRARSLGRNSTGGVS